MAAWFQCTQCAARYQFDAAQAGRAFACRSCASVIRVPPGPVSAVPDPEALSMRGGQWHVRFRGGRLFGPVEAEVLEEWVKEGRADGECLVCPDGSEDWYYLGDAFPDLAAGPAAGTPEDMLAPLCPRAAGVPAAGLLGWLPDDREELTEEISTLHVEAWEMLVREIKRGMQAVQLTGTHSLLLGEARYRKHGVLREREALQIRAEHALVAELTAHGTTFYLVVPWGRLGRLPHEFFSLLPGSLPHALALRREREDTFGEGQWIGIDGTEGAPLSQAARASRDDLHGGIDWEWYSDDREFTMVQVWGIQAVPLGPDKFVHAVQTNRRGSGRNEGFGLLWYLERQSACYRFARRQPAGDTHEPHFLFGCCTGQILGEIIDRL